MREARLAVTGCGTVSPIGHEAEALYRAALGGISAAQPAHDLVPPLPRPYVLARVSGWSPGAMIPPMKARRMDRCTQFTLVAAKQALAAAQWEIGGGEDLGIVLGTNTGGAGPVTEFLRVLLSESPEAAPPIHFPNTVANAPASQTAIELGIRGPNATLSHKEASGLSALLYARFLIADGRARAILAGGSDECSPYYLYGYGELKALAGSRADGSGFIAGEGSYQVLLEEEDAARGRGAAVLARIAGLGERGFSSYAYQFGADPQATRAAVDEALADAGCEARDIGFVFRGANGVREVERVEEELLAERFAGVPAFALKPLLGEGSGAPVAAIQVAAHAWRHGTWPGAGEIRPAMALVLGFAAGGNVMAAVLGAPPAGPGA